MVPYVKFRFRHGDECRHQRLTTACSGRDMDKVPKVNCRQRAADAGRYASTMPSVAVAKARTEQ
jgi:hypothetical protein